MATGTNHRCEDAIAESGIFYRDDFHLGFGVMIFHPDSIGYAAVRFHAA